ncbi:uncharacterized protein LOC108163865 [Drosophila miranda]|uniref:uncharacterized protein LOC108163865 n=1 Tax=Drosophila miranda TaxID=7229 RepID=UPI00143F0D07|nr:uncharacterized protein LOC108163865 [Drosophila miranda]
MANARKGAKPRKPRSSVAARRVKKPNPVRLRSLGDLKASEMIKVESALHAATNLASKEANLKENLNLILPDEDYLPDDIESVQSESKDKIQNRVDIATKLLGFVESEDTTPLSLSEFLARCANRSATKSPDQEKTDDGDICQICELPKK